MHIQMRNGKTFGMNLRTWREARGLSLRQMGEGVYSVSMIARIEQNQRVPRFMEMNRMLARLGIPEEESSAYLYRVEFARWRARQRMMRLLIEGKTDELQLELETYQMLDEDSKAIESNVEHQYLEVMRYLRQRLCGEPVEVLRETLERALAYTISDVESVRSGKILPDARELLLIIELRLLRGNPHGEALPTDRRETDDTDENLFVETTYTETPYSELLRLIGMSYVHDRDKRILVERIKSDSCEDSLPYFVLFFKEQEAYCISDVIRVAREAQGIGRDTLCGEPEEAICSPKTLERIEKNATRSYNVAVDALMDRLGIAVEQNVAEREDVERNTSD